MLRSTVTEAAPTWLDRRPGMLLVAALAVAPDAAAGAVAARTGAGLAGWAAPGASRCAGDADRVRLGRRLLRLRPVGPPADRGAQRRCRSRSRPSIVVVSSSRGPILGLPRFSGRLRGLTAAPPASDTLLVGADRSLGCWSLAVPWLAGLVMRFLDRAQHSQARRLARRGGRRRASARPSRPGRSRELRDQQARLARDVHDVVGHSLAVILAQAESAQYLETPTPRS